MKNMPTKSLILFFLLSALITCRDLSQLIQITRNGARVTSRTYYKETSQSHNWTKIYGFGELTPVGQRQMYLLGKQTLQDYSPFFRSGIKPEDVFLRTTGHNRTYHSAQALATGIFEEIWTRKLLKFEENDSRLRPPAKVDEDLIVEGTKIPVPKGPLPLVIKRVSKFFDPLMKLGTTIQCPLVANKEYTLEVFANYSKKADKSFLNGLIDRLELDLELQDKDMMLPCFKMGLVVEDSYYSDSGFKDKRLHPEGEDYEKLMRCARAASIALMGNRTAVTIHNSPMVLEILRIMRLKINELKGKEVKSKPKKYSLYSGHVVNVIGILEIMGIFDRDCLLQEFFTDKTNSSCLKMPPYASDLTFELDYDKAESKGYVNVRLNGEYINFCKENDEKKDKYSCEFESFVSKMKKRADPDWKKHCGIKETSEKKPEQDAYHGYFAYVLGFADLIIIVFLSLLCCVDVTKVRSHEDFRLRLQLKRERDSHLDVSSTVSINHSVEYPKNQDEYETPWLAENMESGSEESDNESDEDNYESLQRSAMDSILFG